MKAAAASAKVVALVPMRHHSQRVPGKNYREVAGKPLYAHILETLSRCGEVGQIVVDTDSPVIMEGVSRNYPSVRRIDRPEHLRGEHVSMNEILIHDVTEVPAEVYLQTHSTNPLVRPETVSRAIETFLRDAQHDSLFSVTRLQNRLWTADGRAINHDPGRLIRTQDLPPVFLENSCIYLFRRQTLLERRNRIGANPLLFEIDPEEAWDVDTEFDLRMVEMLLERRK